MGSLHAEIHVQGWSYSNTTGPEVTPVLSSPPECGEGWDWDPSLLPVPWSCSECPLPRLEQDWWL